MSAGRELKKSHLYRLVYRLQSGNGSWYRYEAYMTFLGLMKGSNPAQGVFNLRPVAGTQALLLSCIEEAEDLGDTQGRDDRRHRAKKSLGRIPKEEL